MISFDFIVKSNEINDPAIIGTYPAIKLSILN